MPTRQITPTERIYASSNKKTTAPLLNYPSGFLAKLEKEAFTIYWSLKKLEDLVGGVRFTIRTDHRNLLHLNNQGSRKDLQWKLDIQHCDAIIEHVPGELYIPTDLFSHLVPKAPVAALNHIVILQCTDAQRLLMKESHKWFRCRPDYLTLNTTSSTRDVRRQLATFTA